MEQIFIIMFLFVFKHFIADYPLQSVYMLKKGNDEDWVLPLLLHSLVHGLFTLCILLYYTPTLWWLSIVEVMLHFVIDRFKAGKTWLGRYNDITKSSFWTALGFDQLLHYITYIWIMWYMYT